MVTKTLEDERSSITADVTLCDACGNPAEQKEEYYKKSDIPVVETAVRQQTGKVHSKTIQQLHEEWGRPVREEQLAMDGSVRARPVAGFELRDEVYAEEAIEDVDTALYDAVRAVQKRDYLTPDPTFELCKDCHDGVANNMQLISGFLEDEPPASERPQDGAQTILSLHICLTLTAGILAILTGLWGVAIAFILLSGLITYSIL